MKRINSYLQRSQRTFWIFFIGGILATVGQLFLFLRPTPFGTPYVLDLAFYLMPAIFYAWYGVSLVSLPFFAYLLFVEPPSGRPGRLLFFLSHIFGVFASLVISQLDHECLRFMGMHLSYNLLELYGNDMRVMPESILEALKMDAGGTYSSLLLLALPILFLLLANRPWLGKHGLSGRLWNPMLLVAMIVLTMVLPTLYRSKLFGSKPRQYKVMPPAILAKEQLKTVILGNPDYTAIEKDIATVRQAWLEAQYDSNWAFTSDSLPMLKTFVGKKTAPDNSWNIVIIVVETLRAKNLQLFNPAEKKVHMPFLEKLATSENGAYWTNFICNGQPTVFSFMALHASMPPHSTKSIVNDYTTSNITGFPLLLRKQGYYCSFFTSTDPDWDNQRYWLRRWYDHVFYEPAFKKNDRFVFREAASHLKEKGRSGQRFETTIFTIANHVPFETPEARFNNYVGEDLQAKIGNTLSYTDDVLREFFDSLRQEPWFDKTIFLVTGDHGYDLGDRGESTGHLNCRHETIWVPLVMYSKHPLQPIGEQTLVASHSDIAPTLLDLLRLHEDNAFWGHSLFKTNPEKAKSFNFKSGNMAVETPTLTAFYPLNEPPYFYEASDKLQLKNISESNVHECEAMRQLAAAHSRVADYLIERDKAFAH